MNNRFNVIGSSYEKSLKKFPNVRDKELSLLLKHADLQHNMCVVDFAAGTGFVTLALAAAIGNGGSVLAVDISEVMLKQLELKAAESGTTNIACLITDDPTLREIPASRYDRIVSLGGFHHVNQQVQVCRSFHRLLKTGGRAVIMDFEDGSAVQQHFDQTVHNYTSTGHSGLFLSASRAENLCRYAGFDQFLIERVALPWHFTHTDAMGEFFCIHHGLSLAADQIRDLTLEIFQPDISLDGSLDIMMNYILLVMYKV